jgi:hypothetical protein
MSDGLNVALTLESGAAAAIVENRGDHVVVRSCVASPPGSTLTMNHQALTVLVKVRGCKRMDDSALPFRIEGRLVSLTRGAREQLFGVKPDAV